jgi:pimeloyl-ACP methyl ester carboxylesterase
VANPPALLIGLCAVAACSASDGRVANEELRIEEASFVELGGIDQWVTIRGDDSRNPILIVVHGGPGDVQSPFASAYAPYERDFVLVQWDQRGAGRTFGKYGDQTPQLTLERVIQDGIELAEYLRSRFNGSEIILLGHSWGTAITTEMVLERPELFAAYVGTGQIASWAESVQWQFDFLKGKARAAGDVEWLAKLEAIGTPDPMNADQYFTFSRPLRQQLSDSDAAWLASMVDTTRNPPLLDEADLEMIGNGMQFSGRVLLPTQMQERLSTTALRFALPYYVIQGRDDVFTPTPPATAYFEKVVAPSKKLVIIEGAGHFALVTHAPEFVAALSEVLCSQQTRAASCA